MEGKGSVGKIIKKLNAKNQLNKFNFSVDQHEMRTAVATEGSSNSQVQNMEYMYVCMYVCKYI